MMLCHLPYAISEITVHRPPVHESSRCPWQTIRELHRFLHFTYLSFFSVCRAEILAAAEQDITALLNEFCLACGSLVVRQLKGTVRMREQQQGSPFLGKGMNVCPITFV